MPSGGRVRAPRACEVGLALPPEGHEVRPRPRPARRRGPRASTTRRMRWAGAERESMAARSRCSYLTTHARWRRSAAASGASSRAGGLAPATSGGSLGVTRSHSTPARRERAMVRLCRQCAGVAAADADISLGHQARPDLEGTGRGDDQTHAAPSPASFTGGLGCDATSGERGSAWPLERRGRRGCRAATRAPGAPWTRRGYAVGTARPPWRGSEAVCGSCALSVAHPVRDASRRCRQRRWGLLAFLLRSCRRSSEHSL
jgi:hypothetical protein